MAEIKINFDNITGKIKPMHGVGGAPIRGVSDGLFHYLSSARIPFSRLHDIELPFGGFRYVDIPNIFRDFDADVDDPDSYDFAFTDILIEMLCKHGCAPIFRLGVSIENYAHIKAYRIHPPKDVWKWAKICEHIVAHYNEGWANGFHYGIKYWEVWNEPEFHHDKAKNQMWTGSALDYYKLYEATATTLKNRFGDSIKVGGYGSCGFAAIFKDPEKYGINAPWQDIWFENVDYALEFFYGFFDYLKEKNIPIDFFSWHSYMGVEDVRVMADFARRELDKMGFEHIEIHLNEWNNAAWIKDTKGTSFASANACAMLCAMQKKPIDVCCYYEAQLAIHEYGGLFNTLTFEPFCTYYAFSAFGELFALGNDVECECTGEGIYAIGATNDNKKAILVTNTTQGSVQIKIDSGTDEGFTAYFISQESFMTKKETVRGSITLDKYECALIKNY